ncbi:MAG: efflux RND transporter permease subunit [Gemmatimonadetes bacterium]|nr:efflux RND transporter permease subunit [Gemmatimonadota bacterium]
MNISGLFIRRPVMTTLVMIAILMFGIFAYRLLPVSDLPTVDYPTLSVSASLPGANPETMAAAVATPLERQFATIPGLDNMTSRSSLGSTNITLQFALSRNIDAAAQDVQSAVSQAMRQLPQDIRAPSIRKSNPTASPILFYALTTESMPLSELDHYAETVLAQHISTVDGVAEVSVFGAQKYAVRVQLDPGSLAQRGIGIDEVASAISSGNVNLPSGVLWGPDRAYTVQASGQLHDAAAFRRLAVTYRNGAPVHLGDLGKVMDDVQNNRSASWFNGKPSVILAIQRQPGTNTVAVARGVRAQVDRLRSQIPAGVNIQILYDRSASIQASVSDVKFTLMLTLFLVVMVIFLFLRNLSATVIPSLALPMSIIGTFSVMYLMGYSLDNLSLMALTLCVGFVVDDAIVMLENIVRHMEMGKRPMQAALDGSREIGFTILSMTLSLTAVFIPILFMGGILGRLFHEFAVTIGVAILVSGFVSLTLTPMLGSRFLRPSKEAHHGKVYDWSERVYARVLGAYERSLGWVMGRRRSTMVFSSGVLVATVALFVVVPKGFLPSEDTGHIEGTTEGAQGISYDVMVAHQREASDIVDADPNVEAFMSFVGGGFGGGNNTGRFSIHLKPRGERLPVDKVINELNRKLSGITGLRVFMQNPPPIRIGGRFAQSLYQFTLQSTNIDTLYEASRALERRLATLPQLIDVTSDLKIGNPQVDVSIDRERAASLGVSAQQVETALYDAYGSRQVSTIYTQDDEYWVIMELLPQYQKDIGALNQLYVRSSNNTLVPMSSVAKLSRGIGPVAVNHSGQVPSVTLSFNLAPNVALGDAVRAVQNAARATLPSSVSTTFSGTAQAFQDTQKGLLLLLGMAIFVIYVVLGILYESFIHPITILSGIPFAAFGALLTLWITGTDLSVYSFVGIIMLVGLVKKNAIMMIDFALDAERQDGKSPAEAILQACSIRFRPIMMTTMAALMATLPIALGTGAGSESRRPLGIAVVGGLAFSQLITLYVTPVVYTYLDQFQRWVGQRIARQHPEPATAAGGLLVEGD